MAKPRNRTALYPHHVQTRIDPELYHAVEALTPGVNDSTRYRRALRALYELALTSPDCPPALYSTLAAYRPGRWVTLHNTCPDIRPRMTGAELLPQYAALISPTEHHASPYQSPAPNPQQPGTPSPLDALAALDQIAPGHRRPQLDRLGRPVTVQTRPLTDAELQQEGARVTALATAEATGQPLPPFELMPWERIVYEDE